MAALAVARPYRLKVLLINYEFPPVGGGAATATWELARAFVQLGHRPIVLTARYRDRRPTDVPPGVALIEVPALRRRREACTPLEMLTFMTSATLRIRGILRREQIDGMIAFFSIPCGPIAWWGALGTKIPYVVSLRGGDVPGTEPGLNTLHRLLAPFRRRVLRRATAVVANSTALQQRALRADGIPTGVIPNGVDSIFFFPPSERRAAVPFRWLFVGRLQAQKNLGWLLERLGEITGPSDPAWVLDVVGDGPMRDTWTKLAAELGLNSRVHWHGWQTRQQVRDFYRRSHALLQPSLYEGMANTVLEAMACGLAIVASDDPANTELVETSGAGLCLPLREPAAATAALRRAMAEGSGAPWGHRARACAVERFSWSSVAAAYVEALTSISPPS